MDKNQLIYRHIEYTPKNNNYKTPKKKENAYPKKKGNVKD